MSSSSSSPSNAKLVLDISSVSTFHFLCKLLPQSLLTLHLDTSLLVLSTSHHRCTPGVAGSLVHIVSTSHSPVQREKRGFLYGN